MPRVRHASVVQRPWSLDLGLSKLHFKAAQMKLLWTSTAPLTKLWRKSSIGLRFVPWIWSLDLGPPRWHRKAAQRNLT